MLTILLIIIFLVDGVTRGNLAPEAAAWRAGLWLVVVVVGLVVAWRDGAHLPVGGAFGLGVILALSVSETYHRPTGGGLGTWVLYGWVYAVQWRAQRDVLPDLARAGLVVCGLVGLAALSGMGHPAGGDFNKNMVGAFLLAVLPAMAARYGWPAGVVGLGALAVIGSRGAGLAGALALGELWLPELDRLTRQAIMETLGALAVVGVVFLPGLFWLVSIRPDTLPDRWLCFVEVSRAWIGSHTAFGLGPAFRLQLSTGYFADNAHSALPTLAAQAGLVGLGLVGLTWAGLGRGWPKWGRWQWATLAGLAVLGIIENLAGWWPVGIVAALVLATHLTATPDDTGPHRHNWRVDPTPPQIAGLPGNIVTPGDTGAMQ